MLHCPFCGADETDRIDLEGKRFLVFRCLFTPEVDPSRDDAALEQFLRESFHGSGDPYFRRTCDRLHLFVTKGEGAALLGARPGPVAGRVPPSELRPTNQ